LISVLAACHKKDDTTPDTPTAQRAGIYILNQGGLTHNNGSLTYYDYSTKTLTPDIFNAVNGKGLGDTPNDIKIYGSKMYVVVDVSGVVQVLNPKTAKIIKSIDMKNPDGTTRDPRSIVFNAGKAFISQYNGTVAVLDTASLTIDKFITVGPDPEQMVVSNGKLYVANSGGLNASPDKTVSVIDLTTLTETKKVTVIVDPVSVSADGYGNVYVFSAGDYYAGTPGGMTIINNVTDVVKSQNATTLAYGSSFIVNGDLAYYLSGDGKVVVYNVKTQTVVNNSFITDGTILKSPYNLAFDSTTGEVFVSDALNYASNGTLYAFDKTGKKEYTITVGINPGAFAFVNK
jgi:hypothetical protein